LREVSQTGGTNVLVALEAHLLPYAGSMRVATWAFATVVGFALFYFGMVMGSFVPWLALPLTISGIAAALYSAWVLRQVWREVKTNAPVVTVDGRGFHDTRLGEMIPWREVKRLTRHQPGTQVMLQIEAVRAERFLKPRYKFPLGRQPARPVPQGQPVTANLSGLDVAGDRIVAAAEAFFAAAQP